MAVLIVVYRVADGAAVSATDSMAKVANPLPAGLATKTFDPAPDVTGMQWDPPTLDFVAIPPPTHNAMYAAVTALINKNPATDPWTQADLANALRALLAMTRNLVT